MSFVVAILLHNGLAVPAACLIGFPGCISYVLVTGFHGAMGSREIRAEILEFGINVGFFAWVLHHVASRKTSAR